MVVTNTTFGILETLVFIGVFLAVYSIWPRRQKRAKVGLEYVPSVPGWLPFFGHWLSMRSDPSGFLEACYKKYGKIFVIRWGSTKMAVLVDPAGVKDFFSVPDEVLSTFSTFLHTSYVSRALSSTLEPLRVFVPLFQQGIIIPFEKTLTITANSHLKRLTRNYMEELGKGRVLTTMEITDKLFQAAIFQTIFGSELNPSILKAFNEFENAFRYMNVVAFFLHPTLMKLIAGVIFRPKREAYTKAILPTLLKYMNDPSKTGSEFIRKGVDTHFDVLGGRKLNQIELCESLLACHLTVITSPPPLLGQVLRELSQRPDLWKRLREELTDVDTKTVLENKLLHACFMEGTRLGYAALTLFRPTFPHTTFGGFDLSNVHMLVIPGQILTEREIPNGNFKNPKEYRPERFLGENPEPTDRNSLFLWHGGKHACPGRRVAIETCKLFIHNLVQQCDLELVYASKKTSMGGLPTTTNQTIKIKITPLTKV